MTLILNMIRIFYNLFITPLILQKIIRSNKHIKEAVNTMIQSLPKDEEVTIEKEITFNEAMEMERISGKKYWKVLGLYKAVIIQSQISSSVDKKLPSDHEDKDKEENTIVKSSIQNEVNQYLYFLASNTSI